MSTEAAPSAAVSGLAPAQAGSGSPVKRMILHFKAVHTIYSLLRYCCLLESIYHISNPNPNPNQVASYKRKGTTRALTRLTRGARDQKKARHGIRLYHNQEPSLECVWRQWRVFTQVRSRNHTGVYNALRVWAQGSQPLSCTVYRAARASCATDRCLAVLPLPTANPDPTAAECGAGGRPRPTAQRRFFFYPTRFLSLTVSKG